MDNYIRLAKLYDEILKGILVSNRSSEIIKARIKLSEVNRQLNNADDKGVRDSLYVVHSILQPYCHENSQVQEAVRLVLQSHQDNLNIER